MPEIDPRAGGGGAVPGESPICFCFNVTERDVERHFAEGSGTYESLVEKTRIGTKCTACLLDLDLALDRIHQARRSTIIADGDGAARRTGLHHALDFVDSGFFVHDGAIRTAVRLSNFSQLFGAGAACVPFDYELVAFSEAGNAVGRRTGHVAPERDVTVEIAPDDGAAMRGWFLLALTAREDGFFGTMRPQVALRGAGWCATFHTQPHMMASVGRYRHEVVLQGDGRDLSAAVVVVNGSRRPAAGALVLRDPQDGTERESAFGLPGNGCRTLDLAHAFPGAPAGRPLFVSVRCDRPTRNHIVNIHADASWSVDHFPN
jgi:bacterioferritin-associated ferredoxin